MAASRQKPRQFGLVLCPRRAHGGAVAQLGERLVRNEEVRGSTPLGSTRVSARFIGFSASGRSPPKRQNSRSVTTLAQRDGHGDHSTTQIQVAGAKFDAKGISHREPFA